MTKDTLPLAPSAPTANSSLSLLPAHRSASQPPRPRRWTAEMKVTFLEHLAACHNVAEAARAVGMSRQSAYRLKARAGYNFEEAWNRALENHLEELHQAMMHRAIHGTRIAHYYKGQHTHDTIRYDERLAIHLYKSMSSDERRTSLFARRDPPPRDSWDCLIEYVTMESEDEERAQPTYAALDFDGDTGADGAADTGADGAADGAENARL